MKAIEEIENIDDFVCFVDDFFAAQDIPSPLRMTKQTWERIRCFLVKSGGHEKRFSNGKTNAIVSNIGELRNSIASLDSATRLTFCGSSPESALLEIVNPGSSREAVRIRSGKKYSPEIAIEDDEDDDDLPDDNGDDIPF